MWGGVLGDPYGISEHSDCCVRDCFGSLFISSNILMSYSSQVNFNRCVYLRAQYQPCGIFQQKLPCN